MESREKIKKTKEELEKNKKLEGAVYRAGATKSQFTITLSRERVDETHIIRKRR